MVESVKNGLFIEFFRCGVRYWIFESKSAEIVGFTWFFGDLDRLKNLVDNEINYL